MLEKQHKINHILITIKVYNNTKIFKYTIIISTNHTSHITMLNLLTTSMLSIQSDS